MNILNIVVCTMYNGRYMLEITTHMYCIELCRRHAIVHNVHLKSNCFGLCFQTTESALDDDKLSTPICYVSMNDIQTTEDTTEKPDEAQITFDTK